ncbi:hypothetical protein F5Y09DRAFT_323210 [Xylaria sp. FL1042]|nr:hypothetical protein F5Y09DRAFT_323210 [Xylaria sp. FL1042]
MLLRRLSPGTLSAQSRSAAYLSQQIHGKARCLYKGSDLRLGFPKHEQRQHLSRPYSNYAPRGPPPYYSPYGPQPKSRTSRLKDMAIGSALTIATYLVYNSYEYWRLQKEVDEEEELASKINECFSHYDRLAQMAFRGDDGSPESTEKIRSLLKERAMAVARVVIPKDYHDKSITDFGPLPKLPEDHKCVCHEVQRLEDGDTLMLMPPQQSVEELENIKGVGEDGSGQVVTHKAIVAINAFAGDVAASDPGKRIGDPGASKFHEIICRSTFMLDKLRQEGIMDNGLIGVTVFLWDDIFYFVYDEGTVLLMIDESLVGSIIGNRLRLEHS